MRQMISAFTGLPRNAPSRSTTWRLAAPSATNRRATSSGESEKTVASSARPWRSRTAFPPWMSIAGITWNGIPFLSSGRVGAQAAEVPEQPEARALALLRVELDGEAVPTPHRRRERDAVDGAARRDPGLPGHRVIGVDEVEIRTGGDPLEDGVVRQDLHRVPPHVRHLQHPAAGCRHVAGEPYHPAREEAHSLVPAELLALGKQELHPDADPQERAAGGEVLPQEREQPLPRHVRHAVPERPHPGENDPPARRQRPGVTAHLSG